MLYLISIGLWDEKDMSLKALEAAKKCDLLYAEFYTSNIGTDPGRLSKLVGKPVAGAERGILEERSQEILEKAKAKNVGVLVPGDALGATTHISLLIDARKMGIKTEIVHGSSILTAVGETGLQLYKFGRTVTLSRRVEPSLKKALEGNRKLGLHTLILLDIGLKASEGLELLLKAGVIKHEDRMVAACRLGGGSEIAYGEAGELAGKKGLEKTPAVLVIPGKLHFLEEEFLRRFSAI